MRRMEERGEEDGGEGRTAVLRPAFLTVCNIQGHCTHQQHMNHPKVESV